MAGENIIGDSISSMGVKMPSMPQLSSWAVYLGIGLLIAGGLAFGIIYYFYNLKFDKKIVLFKKIAGQIIPVATDKGMFARVGDAGDYWLVLRKFKKVLPRPKIMMSQGLIWYYEREDGEWINFSLADIDEVLKKAKAYYVDEDMRLQRLGIQKNLKERLQKTSFWEKYGQKIAFALFVLIVTVCLVILFNKITGLYQGASDMAGSINNMAQAVENMATRMGGGVKPA